VQTDQRSINQKQLLRSQELVNAGTIPKGDLLDVKATVASDQRVIVKPLMISKLSLAQLLQLDTFQDFDVADNTEVEDNKILLQTPIAIYDKAKEQRTELKLAQINLEIAEKNVAIAKGFSTN
jgi:outer membrane protein